MKILISVLTAFILCTNLQAQSKVVKAITTDTARYEIYSIPTSYASFFKLDKYTGKVYMLTREDSPTTASARALALKNLTWTLMPSTENLSKSNDSRPKYQIYKNGDMSAVLLNTETGNAWYLGFSNYVIDTEGKWFPINDNQP